MKIVVDTNILFSYFWKDSFTRKLIVNSNMELISCEKAIEEIKKYSIEIMKKTGLNGKDFEIYLRELMDIIKFLKREEYLYLHNEAIKISPDKSDADFLALCLKEKCFLWSNDFTLKEQKVVKVLSTEEIFRILI